MSTVLTRKIRPRQADGLGQLVANRLDENATHLQQSRAVAAGRMQPDDRHRR